MSWTSPIMPKLHGEENPFDHIVSTTEEAWIAAFTPLGSAIGPLAAGYCADKLGRKKALLFLALPMIAGFLILASAKQVGLYYFARLVAAIFHPFGLMIIVLLQILVGFRSRQRFCSGANVLGGN